VTFINFEYSFSTYFLPSIFLLFISEQEHGYATSLPVSTATIHHQTKIRTATNRKNSRGGGKKIQGNR
jgi:hypothetical protein